MSSVVRTYPGVLVSNTKEWRTDGQHNIDDSPEHSADRKKRDAKHCIPCEFTYMKFYKRPKFSDRKKITGGQGSGMS